MLKEVIINNYRAIDREYILQIIISFLLFIVSLFFNYYLSIFATKSASNPLTDVILSNIPVYDVTLFFVYGPLIMWIFFFILCLVDPKRISFSLKTISLFIIIRAIFSVITHLAPFPDQIVIDSSFHLSSLFSSGGSLFFSGHTGTAYLLALIFWEDKIVRYIMLTVSVFFACIVLLGHLHYSIDVLGAYFITYAIYALAKFLFERDRRYFISVHSH